METVYIIAGQSNAGRMLATLNDLQFDTHNTHMVKTGKYVGYGYGGSSLKEYREQHEDSLLAILEYNCSNKSVRHVLVWYQGENDVLPALNTNYESEIQSFFYKVRQHCPDLIIVSVVMENVDISQQQDWETIQIIQQRIGNHQVSARYLPKEDWVHLTRDGYKTLFNLVRLKVGDI